MPVKRCSLALMYHMRVGEKRLLATARRYPKVSPQLRGMIRLTPRSVSIGMAIGMFWGFAPMPFQMIPATFFCWVMRANLPSALVCVWISNPLTYAPIFYVEYLVGASLFADSMPLQWADFQNSENIKEMFDTLFLQVGKPILQGAAVVSVFMAAVGYGMGRLVFYYWKQVKKSAHEHPR